MQDSISKVVELHQALHIFPLREFIRISLVYSPIPWFYYVYKEKIARYNKLFNKRRCEDQVKVGG